MTGLMFFVVVVARALVANAYPNECTDEVIFARAIVRMNGARAK